MAMLVGVDQVLLDLVVEVDADLDIFKRYDIVRNTQCLAEAQHLPLLTDLLARAGADTVETQKVSSGKKRPAPSIPIRTTPGGSVSNSLRAAAWWLRQQQPRPAVPAVVLKMLGRVGPDAAGERLRRELQIAGVSPVLEVASVPKIAQAEQAVADMAGHTGICACLIAGKERTMVTELGAGRSLGSKLMESVAAATTPSSTEEDIKLPRMVVLSGYYAQADPDGSSALCARCEQTSTDDCIRPILAFTVGAAWCCGLPAVQAIVRKADFVFANEQEVLALASAIAPRDGSAVLTGGSADEAFRRALEDIASWKQQGLLVGTCGSRSVGAVQAGSRGSPLFVPVQKIEPAKYVDDVGAGDAFLGAFLVTVLQALVERGGGMQAKGGTGGAAACLTDKDIESAVKAGIAAASAVLQCIGCQFPQEVS